MHIVRSATATWHGSTPGGYGVLSSPSTALDDMEFNLPARVGQPDGKTSPEELLAASHAQCFAMSLASVLANTETPSERLAVTSEVTMGTDTEGRFKVTKAEVAARGESGDIGAERFEEAVQAAHAMCAFSRLLVDSGADVTISAALAAE